MLQRAYLVPSFRTAKPGQSEALEVLAHILGGGKNSRLYRALVVDKHVAVMAGAGYDSWRARHVEIRRLRRAAPGRRRCRSSKAAIDAVIAEVIGKGVDARGARSRQDAPDRRRGLCAGQSDELARWYGTALTTGSTVDDVRHWPDRIRAVTAERGAGRRAPMARQAALGHRLSGQGHEPAGGEEIMTRRIFGYCRRALRAGAARGVAPAASAMTSKRSSARPVSRPGWCASSPCRWSSLSFAFQGGSSQDDADKSGTANLAADLLDEGAGDLDGKTFHERLENHAIELGFQRRPRQFPRLAAHAQRAPRRGFRSAAVWR